MVIKNERDIESIVRADAWMMRVLMAAESLDLPDWWIGAGFLRNKVWDAISGNEFTASRDVDLVYFDASDTTPEADWKLDDYMWLSFPFAEWEVRNQARMHIKSGCEPFTSTADGIAHWIETATCVAIRLKGNRLEFLFCYGGEDLYGMIARPVPINVPDLHKIFRQRITEKGWRKRWPGLRVVES